MSYFAGVDIGSAFSKAVIMKEDKILSHYVMPSGGDYKLAAGEVFGKALEKAKLSPADISACIATGYGAKSVPFANGVVSDISAGARGIAYIFPSVRTVIDVGGQFSRVFKVNERGKPTGFLLSEKCAAGSGRFLQIIAKVLQVGLEDIGELSLRSKQNIDFNTGCAVFAESEAISRLAEGAAKEDILAGVHRALAAKIQSLVARLGVEPDCALIGGGAKDIGLLRRVEEGLGCQLLVPDEPQVVAALGSAIIAREGG